MQIRQARPDDATWLSSLACESYAAHFASIWSPRGLAAFLRREFAPAMLLRALAAQDQAWYVAFDADGPAGFAKVNWHRTEPGSGMQGAELQKIYFLPGRTGRGLGAGLLAHVTAQAVARGEPHLWLNVLGPNQAAQRFYSRHGFERLGTVSFQLEDRVLDMIAMGRALD